MAFTTFDHIKINPEVYKNTMEGLNRTPKRDVVTSTVTVKADDIKSMFKSWENFTR